MIFKYIFCTGRLLFQIEDRCTDGEWGRISGGRNYVKRQIIR